MFVPGMVSGYINPGLQVPWQDSPSFHWYPSSTPITAHYITRQNGFKWLAYTSTSPYPLQKDLENQRLSLGKPSKSSVFSTSFS